MTFYHITYIKEGELKHFHTKRIIKARSFISNNFDSVLSCWRDVIKHKKSSTERIFRGRKGNEPQDYFNNKIKAKRP